MLILDWQEKKKKRADRWKNNEETDAGWLVFDLVRQQKSSWTFKWFYNYS